MNTENKELEHHPKEEAAPSFEHKTEKEIRDLKRCWRNDPCWDIEDTEGFEAHKQELLAFRLQCKKEWDEAYNARLDEKAKELGCIGNRQLASYVIGLEMRLKALEGIVNP